MSLQILFRWLSALCLNLMLAMYLVNGPDAQARIIRVSQSGDNTDGNSWATAYLSISTAVSQALDGDSIWAANGTYTGNIVVERNVAIMGGFSGKETDNEEGLRDPYANRTIIDGGSLPHGLMGCVSDCTIDGFLLKNAGSTGVLVYNGANVSFMRCQITDNHYAEGMTFGGGVAVSDAVVSFVNCEINYNIGTLQGSGIEIKDNSSVYMKYCTIDHNTSYSSGGGGITCSHSSIIMENCIVTNNSAVLRTGDEPISDCGGIRITGYNHPAILTNCLIANNKATEWQQIGIGDYLEPYVTLENCTIIGNKSADVHWGNTPPTMTNCIIWGANGMLDGEQGEADISYSCIQGGYTGEGNISEDPLFRDLINGNYRLLRESPCIDTGDTSGPSDDLRGCHRPVDIAGIGHEATDTYDMGAYEVQLYEVPTPTPTQVPSQIDPGSTMLYQ